MLRLRPFRSPDAKEIINWTSEPKEFYKWTAGIMGEYPVTEKRLLEAVSSREDNTKYFPLVAFDEDGLGVFDNNPAAYNCYKSVGFKEIGIKKEYELCGEKWTCIGMVKGKD